MEFDFLLILLLLFLSVFYLTYGFLAIKKNTYPSYDFVFPVKFLGLPAKVFGVVELVIGLSLMFICLKFLIAGFNIIFLPVIAIFAVPTSVKLFGYTLKTSTKLSKSDINIKNVLFGVSLGVLLIIAIYYFLIYKRPLL